MVRRPKWETQTASIVLIIELLLLSGCAGAADLSSSFVGPPVASSWRPSLSEEQIATVRQAFPLFQPEMFAPNVDPTNSAAFLATNFAPALFFGEARPRGMRPTAGGVLVETNNFDGVEHPQTLPAQVTYFDRQMRAVQVALGPVEIVPLHKLEGRMHYGQTPGAAILGYDRRNARIDLAEVEHILRAVQNSVAVYFPAAAQVDIRQCEVVIEPTIFYVYGSNLGNLWAGGLTHDLGNGRFRLQVMLFYINGEGQAFDWRQFLVDEAMNFFVISVGRRDLVI